MFTASGKVKNRIADHRNS